MASPRSADSAPAAVARLWAPDAWLADETVTPVVEINEQALLLLRERAISGAAPRPALLAELAPLWASLDPAAVRRVASCPYLLLDAGFTEPARWSGECALKVGEAERAEGFFSASDAHPLARLVLTFAWHLTRTQRLAARFVLGMSAPCAELVAGLTLAQTTRLAERQAGWLAPRWAGRLALWRELLEAGLSGEAVALERVQLRGLQMLAGEMWRLSGSAPAGR